MTITEANVTVMVRNMDTSIAFYQSIGFTVKQRWGNHYAQLAVPGVVLGLHPSKDDHGGGSGNISIGLTADDYDGAKQLLDDLSMPYSSRQEEGGSFLHFTDPDGNALYFIKPRW